MRNREWKVGCIIEHLASAISEFPTSGPQLSFETILFFYFLTGAFTVAIHPLAFCLHGKLIDDLFRFSDPDQQIRAQRPQLMPEIRYTLDQEFEPEFADSVSFYIENIDRDHLICISNRLD
jgi:hypothetical protein